MLRTRLALLTILGMLGAACGDGAGRIPSPELNSGPATTTLYEPGSGVSSAPAGPPFPDPTGSTPNTSIAPPGTGGQIDGDWFICIGAANGSGDVCSRLLSPGFGLYGGRISVLLADGEIMQPGDSYCEITGGGSYTFNGSVLVLSTQDGNQTLRVQINGDRAQVTDADGETGMLRRIAPSQSTGPCQYTPTPAN